MLITRTSPLTGTTHTRDLPVTGSQLAAWQAGSLIQEALGHLSADDREFIKTGITPEEWEAVFGEED